jgi:hypothetical protein
MLTVRLRLIGSETDAAGVMTVLHGLEGVEHIEQVDDLMMGIDDDSSSAGLSDDIGGGMHEIEVDVPDRILAERFGATVEFVDEF